MRLFSRRFGALLLIGLALVVARLSGDEFKSGKVWPRPKLIDPGAPCGGAPSDALVLIGGQDLSAWVGADKWLNENGAVTVRGGERHDQAILRRLPGPRRMGHAEKVEGSGQGRGNSGVYLMGRYEVQILDSYDNETYYDGQAGSIYKQNPPLVNVCRKPGEWQTYDIIFMRRNSRRES